MQFLMLSRHFGENILEKKKSVQVLFIFIIVFGHLSSLFVVAMISYNMSDFGRPIK